LRVRYQPIQVWPHAPTPPADREVSKFSADYNQTLDELELEILKLDGSDVILQGFWPKSNMRNDGWPMAIAKADSPGVIVSFSTRLGNLSYHGDRFKHWKDNLRAIAKTLEALRAIQRYGTVAGDEQYRGFVALAAPAANDRAAAETLIRLAGSDMTADSLLAQLGRGDNPLVDYLRKAALKLVHGRGNATAEQLDEIEQAVKMLKEGLR
jgi:hypothetical protein